MTVVTGSESNSKKESNKFEKEKGSKKKKKTLRYVSSIANCASRSSTRRNISGSGSGLTFFGLKRCQ